ncbi:MAG: hypothetical protein QF805_23275, partial [Pirellulaceae bacterium]|nr:hypothetical protein [Pirellulaceae bacterium]
MASRPADSMRGQTARPNGRLLCRVMVIALAAVAGAGCGSTEPGEPVDVSTATLSAESQPSDQPPALAVSIAAHLFEETADGGGAPAPFSDESQADELAIGVVQEVVGQGDVKRLPVNLNKVFIGRLPTGRFLAADKMVVRIECSLPPKNLGARSQLYKPGALVVVYLARDKANAWTVTSLLPINPGNKKYWTQRLQTFADVVLAGESDEPEQEFRKLLVIQPNGGLEFTLLQAMMIHPHAAARPVVRELWRNRVKQHPVDPPKEGEMVGAMSFVYLMRTLNESDMLDEILEHGLRQKSGRRSWYLSELRVMGDYANDDARERLRGGLEKFLDDSPALETLDSVKDRDV